MGVSTPAGRRRQADDETHRTRGVVAPRTSGDCPHDLDPEYLHPRDVDVLALEAADGELVVRFVFPCPECDRTLEVEAPVRSVEESALTLPLDADEIYD